MAKKEELKFMGQPVVDAGEGRFKVAKTDFDNILNDLGVTKEVRKVVAAAENTIAEEAVKFTGDMVVKTKEPSSLELGSGPTKLKFNMETVSSGRNPKTGEETVSYGRFSMRKKGVVCSAIKDGPVLAAYQKQIEQALAKK